jgi:hypothetical protein
MGIFKNFSPAVNLTCGLKGCKISVKVGDDELPVDGDLRQLAKQGLLIAEQRAVEQMVDFTVDKLNSKRKKHGND